MSFEPDDALLMRQIVEQERAFEWLKAAALYQQALKRPAHQSPAARAEVWGRRGFCLYRASRQATTQEGFQNLLQQAVQAYDEAATLSAHDEGTTHPGRTAEYQALAAYMGTCLPVTSPEKRVKLDACRALIHRGVTAYQETGDALRYGRLCNELVTCLFDRLYLAVDWEEKQGILMEGIEYADKAIGLLSTTDNRQELLRSYASACLLTWYAANVSEEDEERAALMQRSLRYSQQADALSKDVADPYYASQSNWAAAFSTLLFTSNVDAAGKYAHAMLRQGQVMRDNYVKGKALYLLALVTNWRTLQERDAEKKRDGHQQIMTYAEEAIHALQLVAHDLYLAETYWVYTESLSALTRDMEATPQRKQVLMEKAVDIGRTGLHYATKAGSADALGSTLHALSKSLQFAAQLAPTKTAKKPLLEEALEHREEYNRVVHKIFPFSYWNRGVGLNYEGVLVAELAKITEDPSQQITLLQRAVTNIEDGLMQCDNEITSRPLPTRIAVVARYRDALGNVLNALSTLTGEQQYLRRAIEVYSEAARLFQNVDFPSQVAEAHWKTAQNQAQLATHQHAASSFEQAATGFEEAAETLPHFAEFYHNYALYMKAWSAIELAKHAHQSEDYDQAAHHYQTAAQHLDTSQPWRYLSKNFTAWALLEQAEHLSKLDRSLEAIDHFESASTRFIEAKQALQKRLSEIESVEERQNAHKIIVASDHRRDYCLGRMLLEEARMDDKAGKGVLSANRYRLAAATFEKLVEEVETEADRHEISLITLICQAWERLKLGEANEAPDLCLEAAELFQSAINHSKSDRSNLVLLGNHAFCRALENGARFQATKDRAYYFKTKQHLESASNYFIRAGYETAALWINATELTFDAFIFIDQAEAEVHPQRLDNRVKLYAMAEKCLEQAAALYEQAKYSGKQNEVMKSLEKVKEKRKFATSLSDVFQAPDVTLSTRDIPFPTSTHERPVGLESFEHINIQVHLDTWMKEINVGDNLELEVDFINVGRHPAILLRLENIAPQGFEFVERGGGYQLENTWINLRGRKLDPLSRDEIRYTLKAHQKGTHALNPVVVYQDETGNLMSQALEPIEVTVKEFGIMHWLRGPRE